MLRNAGIFFTSVLTSAALIVAPATAQAGGMSHIGTGGAMVPNLNCKQPVSAGKTISINKPVTINSNINVYKPVTINKNLHVVTNIDNSKTIDIDKTINVNTSIDNSKSININKNIDDSRNIDISKSIVINKGGSDADAQALAIAMAQASANSSASAVVNFNGGSSNAAAAAFAGGSGGAAAYYGGGIAPDAPGPFAGGDIGALAVDVAPARCTVEDATVIKAIHAVCVAPDGRQFPASHMLADSWIESSYEGEVARCIPGAHLKLTIGAVFQSSEGMASIWSHGQILECTAREAVRHYKDGMLKCAAAMPVRDCTERNNLRLYGSGDMFFTYRTRVCRQSRQEYSESSSRSAIPEGERGAAGASN